MKKLNVKKMLSVILGCIFTITIAMTVVSGMKSAKAEEAGETVSTLATLFNETNTYNTTESDIHLNDSSKTKGENKSGIYDNPQYYLSYNMSNNNGNKVAEEAQITVLTHGYGSDASAWSNIVVHQLDANGNDVTENKFAPTKTSLIYKFWQKHGNNLQVVYAKFTNNKNFFKHEIKDLTAATNYAFSSNVFNAYNTTSSADYDFSKLSNDKHLLILFESSMTLESNDNVYFQFNYVLSKMAKQYKENTGVLPKYNLIGHSRGGITNLQYALDHPDMVDNLISVGTPYNGSTTALTFGEMYEGKMRDALRDIIDSHTYNGYKKRWNDNYNLYRGIHATAIGAYSSLMFLSDVVFNDMSGEIPTEILSWVEPTLIKILVFKKCSNYFSRYFNIAKIKWSVAALKEYYPEEKIVALINILINELNCNSGLASFENDLFVDLPSQQAFGYRGFSKVSRIFTRLEHIDFTQLAQYAVPIVHNLEPRDNKIMDIIMGLFGGYSSGISYEVKDDGTLKILRVHKEELFDENATTYEIPSKINNKLVSEIGEDAFSGVFDSFCSVKTLIIPPTIKTIGDYAFSNCESLTSIDINNQTDNVKIGEGAFAKCSKLVSIKLPAKMTEISDGVFSECKALTEITLPSTVTAIGGGAFNGCTSLTSVSGIDAVTEIGNYAFNDCYSLCDISLPENLVTLGEFAFADCRKITGTITIPQGVTQMNNAFMGCSRLSKIELHSGITSISEYAFIGCEGLTSINIPKNVASIGSGAFYGCKGIANITVAEGNSYYYVSGNCLIRTEDNALVLVCNDSTIPNDITAIEDFACANCNQVTTIKVPDNVEYIGVGAFYGCSELTDISLPNSLKEIGDNAFTDCIKLSNIVIPNNVDKLGSEAFYGCESLKYVTLSDSLTIISEGVFANCLQLEEVNLGYNMTTIANYAFYGCEMLKTIFVSTGNNWTYIGSGSLDNTSPELVVYVPSCSYNNYACYDNLWIVYRDKISLHNTSVSLVANGGTIPTNIVSFTYGSYVSYLPQPTLEGYYFDGWYDNPDFVGKEINSTVFWESHADNIVLYAKWSDTPKVNDTNTYEIVYVNDGEYTGSTNPVYYTANSSNISLVSPTRNGYRFLGWYTDENYKSSVITTLVHGTTGDIILYAKWSKIYTVSFNSNGGTSCKSMPGIKGQMIILPSPYKVGCSGTWEKWDNFENNYHESNFGKGYMIGDSDVTLNAIWEGNIYNVIYHNKIIAERNPICLMTYEYKYGVVTPLKDPINSYGHIFKGYFKDKYFNEQIYEVPLGTYGDFNVYIKWEVSSWSMSRGYAVKITDSGRWNQPHDNLYAGADSKTITNCKDIYKSVKFVIDIEIWESDDGYQYLMLYDKYDKNEGKMVWRVTIEHVPGKKSTAHHKYHFEFNVAIEDTDWVEREDNLPSYEGQPERPKNYYYSRQFFLLYGASGNMSDDWNNAELKVQTYFTTDPGNATTDNHVAWNGNS